MTTYLQLLFIPMIFTTLALKCHAMQPSLENRVLHYLPDDQIRAETTRRTIEKNRNKFLVSFEESFAKKHNIPQTQRKKPGYLRSIDEFVSVMNGAAIITISYYNKKQDQQSKAEYLKQRENFARLLKIIIKIISDKYGPNSCAQ